MVKKWVTKLLILISRIETNYLYQNDKIDWDDYISRISYPQTWWMGKYVPFNLCKRWIIYKDTYYHNPLKRFVEIVCGLVVGHEASGTEFGYGGGEFIDRNCRWCDKGIKESITESNWAKEGQLSDLIADIQNSNEVSFDEN